MKAATKKMLKGSFVVCALLVVVISLTTVVFAADVTVKAGKIKPDKLQLPNDTYLTADNAADTGTVDLIKANTSDVAVIPDGSELATSAAPTADADIANKKYVDDQMGAVGSLFGSWASKSNNTTYQAATDGFVCARLSGEGEVAGRTDSSSTPTTIRQKNYAVQSDHGASITMPVKKNDYWAVSGASFVYWIPMGN